MIKIEVESIDELRELAKMTDSDRDKYMKAKEEKLNKKARKLHKELRPNEKPSKEGVDVIKDTVDLDE